MDLLYIIFFTVTKRRNGKDGDEGTGQTLNASSSGTGNNNICNIGDVDRHKLTSL